MPVYDWRERDVAASYLPCKGQRVHWLGLIGHPADTPRPGGTVPVWWRCTRCGTERRDLHDPVTLEVVRRAYVHPDGYEDHADDRRTSLTWKATYLQAIGAVSPGQAAANRRYRKELWEESDQ